LGRVKKNGMNAAKQDRKSTMRQSMMKKMSVPTGQDQSVLV
jgi:hypothetical protein